jgi:hypothetical protein
VMGMQSTAVRRLGQVSATYLILGARRRHHSRGYCPGLFAPHFEVTHPAAACEMPGYSLIPRVENLLAVQMEGRSVNLCARSAAVAWSWPRRQRPSLPVACGLAVGGARAAYAGLWARSSAVPVALWLDHGPWG